MLVKSNQGLSANRPSNNRALKFNSVCGAGYKVGPRYDEVPRDCQNLFALTRFRYIEVLFHIFYYYWKIVRHTEDFVIQRFIISRFHCI